MPNNPFRSSNNVAAAAANTAAILNLAAAGMLPQRVALAAEAALAGQVFQIYGILDPATTAASPNKAPIATWNVSHGTDLFVPNVDGWPALMFVRAAAGASGGIGAFADTTALPAPAPTTLPAVSVFLTNPLALPSSSTVLMLDRTATVNDAVDVWDSAATSTDIGVNTSPPSGVYLGRLRGGGGFLRVSASFIQIRPVAKPNATQLFIAGTAGYGGIVRTSGPKLHLTNGRVQVTGVSLTTDSNIVVSVSGMSPGAGNLTAFYAATDAGRVDGPNGTGSFYIDAIKVDGFTVNALDQSTGVRWSIIG